MNKKLQVFVSSTYTDLIEERQAAVEAILDAGHIPAGMELFKAGKSQMKTIHKWIDDSDVYMLILGGRYGSIEEESGKSYTELEYLYALSKNMPVFAIVLEESFLFTKAASAGKDAVFEKDNIDRYDSFKEFVKTNIVKFVSNIDQIPSIIHSHVNYINNDSDYNLSGWIKNNYKELLYGKSINHYNLVTLETGIKTLNNIEKHLANIQNITYEDYKILYELFDNFCNLYQNNVSFLSFCCDAKFYIHSFKKSDFFKLLSSDVGIKDFMSRDKKQYSNYIDSIFMQTQRVNNQLKIQFTNYILNI